MALQRILIVDDSATARLGISQALRRRGFETDAVATVEEVTAALDRHPDLILVDVQMPEIFGDDLVAWMREKRKVKAPILLCSTRSQEELTRLAGQCGADGWIHKTGRSEDVALRVERRLAHG